MRTGRPKSITAEAEEGIKQLLLAGLTLRATAEKLLVKSGSVERIRKSLVSSGLLPGKEVKQPTTKDVAPKTIGRPPGAGIHSKLAELLLSGMGARQAAEAAGCSRGTADRVKQSIKTLIKTTTCQCGRPFGHRGWCRYKSTEQWLERLAAIWKESRKPLFEFYLGFLSGCSLHDSEVPRGHRCSVRGCPYPAKENDGVCFQHFHFFDYKNSMTDSHLDIADLFAFDDPTRPIFHVGWMYQDKTPNLFSVFRGLVDHGAKMSEDYWQQVVSKKPVTGEMPATVTRGVSGLHHGQGPSKPKTKRSARKQRKANLANRQGGIHPEQKVRKRYEKLNKEERLPMLSPSLDTQEVRQREEDPEVDQSLLDEQERQVLIEQLVNEQQADFSDWMTASEEQKVQDLDLL